MKKLIQHKLHQLRQKSQPQRLRVAVTFSFLAGLMIVILWVTVILPLELRGLKNPSTSPAVTGAVAGIESDKATPTPSETFVPSPPTQTQTFQNLPSSEDSSAQPSSLPVTTTP